MSELVSSIERVLKEIDYPSERMPKRSWAERVPKVLLALGRLSQSDGLNRLRYWNDTSPLSLMGSRNVIDALNSDWGENIGRGSYDEVRRSCIKYLEEAGLVVKNPDNTNRSTNDPTSGYAISKDFGRLCVGFDSGEWQALLSEFKQKNGSFRSNLSRSRDIQKIPISIAEDQVIHFGPGPHNELQKQIIEIFLPKFSPGSELIYIADSTDRDLYYNKNLANEIGMFDLKSEFLPDIVSYDRRNNWVFLVEAVYSSGHISELRYLELSRMLSGCNAEPIFVSAFPDRRKFRSFVADLAWETEVWIADDPDHMIHFNGHKFLGPYAD